MLKRILQSAYQRGRRTLPAAVVILAILAGSVAEAQVSRRVRDRAKRSAERETARQVDRAITKAIRCAVGEYECYRRAKEEGQEVVFVDADGNIINDDQGRPVTDYKSLPPQNRNQASKPASDAGGRDLNRALAEDGRAITRGIRFEAGSAEMRPESREVLDEIARALHERPDWKIRIEVHAGGEGDARSSRELSQRQAESVLRMLTEIYGVRTDRLEATGLGNNRPLDVSDTAESRRINRRVELVRM